MANKNFYKNRYPFQDEIDAHVFVDEKIKEFKKKNKVTKIQYSFFTTPGITHSEWEASKFIKDGAGILTGIMYFLVLYQKSKNEEIRREIPFALVYRDDFNYSIVFLFQNTD